MNISLLRNVLELQQHNELDKYTLNDRSVKKKKKAFEHSQASFFHFFVIPVSVIKQNRNKCNDGDALPHNNQAHNETSIVSVNYIVSHFY